MKRLIITTALCIFAAASFAQQIAMLDNTNNDAISWSNGIEYNFGAIVKDVAVNHDFKFSNTGTTALIISDVKGSCGCTVASFTSEPIAPGGKGHVKATFNAKKIGPFAKTVTVYTNAGQPIKLWIKGEVVE